MARRTVGTPRTRTSWPRKVYGPSSRETRRDLNGAAKNSLEMKSCHVHVLSYFILNHENKNLAVSDILWGPGVPVAIPGRPGP